MYTYLFLIFTASLLKIFMTNNFAQLSSISAVLLTALNLRLSTVQSSHGLTPISLGQAQSLQSPCCYALIFIHAQIGSRFFIISHAAPFKKPKALLYQGTLYIGHHIEHDPDVSDEILRWLKTYR